MSAEILTKIEREGAVWKKIEAKLKSELDLLRRSNDGNLPEVATARLRGQIAAVKDLLSIGTEKPQVPSEDQFKD